MFLGQDSSNSAQEATTMDIGNLEAGWPLNRRSLSNEDKNLAENKQCFKFKTIGCRPWKHSCKALRPKQPEVNFSNVGQGESVVHDV